jgi:hypothetical protein
VTFTFINFYLLSTCTERFYLDPTNNWDDRYASEPTAGQLNPVNPKTYQVVQQVIDEVTSWFTDDYYHAGGDEPVNKCWEDNKEVRDYMKKNNATGNDLLQTFLTKELAMVKKNKKTAILWEDAVTQLGLNIPKETILQVWTGTLKAAVQSGHKVIASSYNFYYLDCRSGNWKYVLFGIISKHLVHNIFINYEFIVEMIQLLMNKFLLQSRSHFWITLTITTLILLATLSHLLTLVVLLEIGKFDHHSK